MKTVLAVILLAASAFAQQKAAIAAAEAACGPNEVSFETETVKDQPVAQVETGKAQVYVIEVFDKVVGELSRPTLRVGLDGSWVGANKGDSYISFPVDPGEHHLCTNWQSHWKRFSKQAGFAGFTAEPGKLYYFRARIVEHGGSVGASSFSLDLEPVDNDEGKFLVASSGLSVSHPQQ